MLPVYVGSVKVLISLKYIERLENNNARPILRTKRDNDMK